VGAGINVGWGAGAQLAMSMPKMIEALRPVKTFPFDHIGETSFLEGYIKDDTRHPVP
jgi:hypothetical protein